MGDRMTVETADVVVIGAGIVGASTAFHLVARRPGLRVLILDRATVASGATGRSSAIVRVHYVDPTEAALAARSLHWFNHWKEAVGGHCGFRRVGFLMIVPPGQCELMARTLPMLQALGADVRLLAPHELAEVDPRISPAGVGCAAYEPQAGYADPAGTAAALVDGARQRGAVLEQQTTVTAIRVRAGRALGVETTGGDITCGAIVLAAGAGSPALLEPLGLDLPLDVRLIRAAALERGPGSRPHPAVIDRVQGVHFRPEGTLTIFGVEPPVPLPGPIEIPSVEESVVREAALRPARRIPELEHAAIRPGWAQLDCFTADGHAVVGSVPDVSGLYLAVGASGTGFKTAPALGEALSGIVLGDGRPDDVAIEPLHMGRFAERRLLRSDYKG